MVHVLHVVRTLGKSGGMERNLHRVVVALRARGIRHSIALLSDWDDVINFGDDAPVIRIVTPPNDPRLILRLRSLINALQPTVIHARNWGAWPDVAAARLGVLPQPSLIWSYHGAEHTDAVPLSKRLVFQTLARATTRIFAVSQAARRLLQQQYGLSHHPIHVVPNGVDQTRFYPGPRPHNARFVFGSAGRLHDIKNFPLLLQATARLLAQGLDVELHLAGDGPGKPGLEALAAQLGITERVRLLGHVDDVPAFLRTLDAFALTSDNEAHPNALLEAMATGLPVIATAVGGAVEVLDEGRAGILIPARDASALATAVAELLRNPERAQEFSQAGLERVRDTYASERMLARYEALYRDPRRFS